MKRIKIAIQGERASFHDVIAAQYFPDYDGRVYADTFDEVFSAVENKQADYGVCAIENSLAGSINQVYDLLLKHDMHIIGEAYQKITLCLLALEPISLPRITEVYSHPVALMQSSKYLDEYLPNAKRLEHHDTAGSAKFIAEKNDPQSAAIAGKVAAALHRLHVLKEGIETNGNTHTRFIIFSRDEAPTNKANKTSLLLRTSHQPGALYEALGAFAKHEINLTKLQSRPVVNEPWQYMFYVDVEAGIQDKNLKHAMKLLDNQNCQYTVLGSYQSATK